MLKQTVVRANRLISLIRYNRDWPKYLYHRYSSGGRPLKFRLRNGQIIEVNWDARWTLNEIYLDHVYDIPGVDLRRCRVILDIGANVGIFSLYAASFNPSAIIYSFEPVEANFATLQRNLRASGNSKGVRPYQLAVGAKCGNGYMEIAAASVTHSLSLSDAGGLQPIRVVDLGWIFEMAGVDEFDFVKMDIEGGEVEVMNACTDDHLRRIRAISMEWHSSMQASEPILSRLYSLGFRTLPDIVGGRPRYLKAVRY